MSTIITIDAVNRSRSPRTLARMATACCDAAARASRLAAMHADHPDMMIVARNASPLAVGLGEGASFIGSDAVALSHLTRDVIYLKDNDYAVIRP